MGWYLVRGTLLVKGGSVQIGADVNLKRVSANLLGTDDALQVGGTANLTGATRIGGAATLAAGLTQTGGDISLGGTITSATEISGTITHTGRLVAPYATATPTVAANGQLHTYLKAGVPYLATRLGGTTYAIALPLGTDGTITITANGTP